MAERVYGLDLGSDYLKIAQKSSGIVMHQKNMIAISNKTDVIAIGDEAFEMYEKVPKSIEVLRPVADGVIADFTALQIMIQILYKGLKGERISDELIAGGNSSFYIAVPNRITDVEKRAFYELIASSSLRTRKIRLIEKPMADCLGAGVDAARVPAKVVVDMGAQTTEISLIGGGSLLASRLLKIGGNTMEEAIALAVKKKHNLVIGMKTAERMKNTMGNVLPEYENRRMEVLGRNLITGLPYRAQIPQSLVFEAIRPTVETISESIKVMIDQTPPDTIRILKEEGIILVGGVARLTNVDIFLERTTGLPVYKPDQPELSTVRGIGLIIRNPKLERVAACAQEALLR